MKRWTTTIILAAVTAGLIFVSVSTADAQPFPGRGMRNGPGMGMGFGPGMMANIPDLTDSQLEKVLELQKDTQLLQIKLHNEQTELMDEFVELSEDTEANSARLGKIQQRMGEIRLQLAKNDMAQDEQMHKILTDKQWEALAVAHAERMKNAQEFGPRGRGAGQGFGPGPGAGQGPQDGRMGFGPGNGRQGGGRGFGPGLYPDCPNRWSR